MAFSIVSGQLSLISSQTEAVSDPVTAKSNGTWFLLLIPSVADTLFIVLLLGLSCGALGRLLLRDAGIGWHIRNGQQMLLTHSITRVDFFSATMSGQPWYAWEWLYDGLIAIIHHVFGLNGVVFYSAAIIASTFVLAFHLAMRRGGSLPITFFLIILSLGASSIHFHARPHVLSWLFTVIWFEVLDSAAAGPSSGTRKRALWLPALMLLWVNLHGGFLVAFVLLGIYGVAAVIEYFTAAERRKEIGSWLKLLGTVAALCVLATFVNPYGYKLHVHIYRYLSDRFLMDRISEFMSPNFHGVPQELFAVILIIAMVALGTACRQLGAARVLVVVFSAYSGLYAARNLPVSSILLTLIIAPLLSEKIVKIRDNPDLVPWLRALVSRVHSFSTRMENLELSLHGHLWIVLVFVLGLWVCMHGGKLGSTQFLNAYFEDKRFPVQAAEVITERDIREPVLSLDYWGGYLIYRLYPQTRVVIDDRHDLYGDQFIKDYLKLTSLQPGWDKVLDEKRVNWVLMPPNSSLGTILQQIPGWTIIHKDGTAVLLHRSAK